MSLEADRGAGIVVATAEPAVRRGRRPIGDEFALLLMAQFNGRQIACGELPNDRGAARHVIEWAARPNPPWAMPVGASREAIEDRLRSKFRRRRAELMAAVWQLNPKAGNSLTCTSRYDQISEVEMANRALKMLAGAREDETRSFGIRSIDSFDEYREACEKMRAITDEYNAAAEKLGQLKTSEQAQAARERAVRASVEFRLRGTPVPESPITQADRERMEVELAALCEAMFRQKEILDEVENRCAHEIMEAVRPRHREMMARILDAVLELAGALDEEADIRRALTCERVPTGSLPTIPAEIRRAVGSRRTYGSGASTSARWLADYVQRKPDFSMVTG